jgi:hypothetical protein
LRAEEKANPPLPRLESSWLCNYVQIFPEPDKMDILTIARYAPQSAHLQFDELDGRLAGVTVSENLYNEVFSSIENRYGRREHLSNPSL